MKVTVIPIVIGALSKVIKRLIQGLEDLEKNWTSRDHPIYSIIEIGQNTKKRLGDLRRLGVTQTPLKDHQLMRIWKTL